MSPILLALTLSLAQAAPETLTHSGRLLTADGAPVDGTEQVRFRLVNAADVERWAEDHTVTFEAGYFASVLGTTTALSPALLAEDLTVVIEVDGTELGRQPLSSVPYALSVEGAVRVTAAPALCDAGAVGTLRYTSGLEVCTATGWAAISTSVPTPPFTLNVNNSATDASGNWAFSTTAATVFDATNQREGTHSLSMNVYQSSPGDWALESSTTSTVWSMHPSNPDWTLEWDYRQPNDNGYGAVFFSSTTAFADSTAAYCHITESSLQTLPNGWLLCANWHFAKVYFHTPAGHVTWAAPGYSTAWRSMRLVRRGTQLELFIDDVSAGTRTLPTITDSSARRLYILGSPNGGSTYPASSYSLLSQMDRIRYTSP